MGSLLSTASEKEDRDQGTQETENPIKQQSGVRQSRTLLLNNNACLLTMLKNRSAVTKYHPNVGGCEKAEGM